MDIPEPVYTKVNDDEIKRLASEGASESASVMMRTHVSLTGASGKVGLYYDGHAWYMPGGCAPSTHIVKQSHVRLRRIVVNEQLSLLTAHKLGLLVPESFIINLDSGDDADVLYASSRYDRIFASDSPGSPMSEPIACISADGHNMPFRLHQEDFAVAMGIPSKDKYERPGDSYLEMAFKLVREQSSHPLLDARRLWDYYLFDYFIGNTDCHIKNLSLLYTEDMKSKNLAPLYDVISTTIYEGSSRDMAVAIDGKYDIDDIDRGSFNNMASRVYMGKSVAMADYDNMADAFEKAITDAGRELMEQGFTDAMKIKDEILLKRGIW